MGGGGAVQSRNSEEEDDSEWLIEYPPDDRACVTKFALADVHAVANSPLSTQTPRRSPPGAFSVTMHSNNPKFVITSDV